MAKNSVRDYDATNANNTDIQSIDISEGCSPAGINNAIREIMADLKDVSTGAVALESPSADSLTVTGDLTVDTNTLYVDSTNNRVGVGTASPTTPLEVSGSGTIARLTGTGTNVYLRLGNTTDTGGYIAYDGTDLQLWSQSAKRITVDSDGLKFGSDTAAANALDDYEYGTWTPVLTASTTNPTYTLSNSTAHYVKIGDMVYFSWYSASVNISSSGVGNAQVEGLPYTAANGTEEYWLFNYKHGTAVNTTNCSGGYVAKNLTRMVFVLDGDISSPSWAAGNGKYLMVAGAYRTTA